MIGKLFEVGNPAPYRHPAVWTREPTDERERLRIGSGIGTLDLFQWLAAVLREQGYEPGDPHVPTPHEHRYHRGLNELESDLRRLWAWNRILPLDSVPED